MQTIQRLVLAVTLWLTVGEAAYAGEHPPTRAQVWQRQQGRARIGRLVGVTGLAATVSGWSFFGAGFAFNDANYHFDGVWWKKAAYDRAWLARRDTGVPMIVAGGTIGGAGVPLLFTGPLVEAYALRKTTDVSVASGWIGVSLLILAPVGAVTMAFTDDGWAVPVALGTAGVVFCAMQLGVNAQAERDLSEEEHDHLYRPWKRHPVVLTGAPMLLDGGGGAMLVGFF